MKTAMTTALLLACCWTPAWAGPDDPYDPDPYYVDPASTPYPPGCATQLSRQTALHGDNAVRFFSGRISLERVHKNQGATGEVQLDMYRLGCAEAGRSLIVAEFKLVPEWVDSSSSVFYLPSLTAEGPGGMHFVPLELRDEPNGWALGDQQHALTRSTFGDYTGGWEDPRGLTWRYVLDVAPGAVWDPQALTQLYNGRFLLQTHADGVVSPLLVVPATHELLESDPTLPLNGRLSGAWTYVRAADQGVVLSFGDLVPPAGSDLTVPREPELLVFLTWYTFDPQGRPLWLSGNARFVPGASEVRIPVIRVTQGRFLAAQVAAGDVVAAGEVVLTARHCALLELDYDLAALDLGAGRVRLQRPFALETAGYPCRDHYARRITLAQSQRHQ